MKETEGRNWKEREDMIEKRTRKKKRRKRRGRRRKR